MSYEFYDYPHRRDCRHHRAHPHDHDHHHHSTGGESPRDNETVPCIGVGGPVGSGKTALIEALVPMLLKRGRRPIVITNDIFTEEDAEHVRRTLEGVLDPQRVMGVETGSCPHTAVRDDPTMNLAAMEEMTQRFPDADIVLLESGGDNRRSPSVPHLRTTSSS